MSVSMTPTRFPARAKGEGREPGGAPVVQEFPRHSEHRDACGDAGSDDFKAFYHGV